MAVRRAGSCTFGGKKGRFYVSFRHPACSSHAVAVGRQGGALVAGPEARGLQCSQWPGAAPAAGRRPRRLQGRVLPEGQGQEGAVLRCGLLRGSGPKPPAAL
eukprot:3530100-Prymnesium_polylepis.1